MFVGTEAFRFTAGRGLGSAENMLEILACVQPCRDQPFSRLAELITAHLEVTSGLICVFLDWDEPRRALVNALAAAGTVVVVFVISETPERMAAEHGAAAQPGHWAVLDVSRVQEDLDRFFAGPHPQ
jgi:hypothetical protein